MVHYVDNFDAKMYEMDSPWTLRPFKRISIKPCQSSSIFHIDFTTFWLVLNVRLHFKRMPCSSCPFRYSYFASSVYLSLSFREKLNCLTFTLSIHLCFIYSLIHFNRNRMGNVASVTVTTTQILQPPVTVTPQQANASSVFTIPLGPTVNGVHQNTMEMHWTKTVHVSMSFL